MYITINSASGFMDEFHRMGRGDQFSYEALEALFDFYDGLGNFELDVIAICCEWTEYEKEEEALEAYNAEDLDELQNSHFMLELENGRILVQD